MGLMSLEPFLVWFLSWAFVASVTQTADGAEIFCWFVGLILSSSFWDFHNWEGRFPRAPAVLPVSYSWLFAHRLICICSLYNLWG